MDDLKIGVIGAGGRGSLAAHAHHPGQGSALVACCDLDPEVLEDCRERYGNDVFLTSDYHDLLDKDLDAVFVCTPDFLHEQHAADVVRAKKAVYLEKPMSITVPGCDHILRETREAGVKLYLGHNMRHLPVILRMKELIDTGAIGQVKTVWCRHFVGHGGDFYFKDWHADRRNSTGMLLQKATHDIDVIHWLTGGYGRTVNALGSLSLYGEVGDRRRPEEKPNPKVDLNNWPPAS